MNPRHHLSACSQPWAPPGVLPAQLWKSRKLSLACHVSVRRGSSFWMEALEAPPGQKATSPVYLLPPAGHQELHVQFKSRKLPAANMTEQEKKKTR